MRDTRILLTLTAAAAAISFLAPVDAGTRAEAPPPPATTQPAQPAKDAFLKGRIVSALAFNPHVSVFDLDVRVDKGIAYLSGAVDNATERDLAIEIARGVEDVHDVKSTITLKPGVRQEKEQGQRTVGQTVDDAGITAAVKGRLLANQSTPGGRINVTTRRGVVTLTGTVDTGAQKDLAGRIAGNTKNVVDVENELTVARQ